jgi:hypothetical protein
MKRFSFLLLYAALCAAALTGCIPETIQQARVPPPPAQKSVAAFATYQGRGDLKSRDWVHMNAEEWQKVAPALQAALECRAPLPNKPEIRAMLRGFPFLPDNPDAHPSVPVSEEYFKKSTSAVNQSVRYNMLGTIVLASDTKFLVFGLPARVIEITRWIQPETDAGGDYEILARLEATPAAIRKSAKLKKEWRKTKTGALNLNSPYPFYLGSPYRLDDKIPALTNLSCVFWIVEGD